MIDFTLPKIDDDIVINARHMVEANSSQQYAGQQHAE